MQVQKFLNPIENQEQWYDSMQSILSPLSEILPNTYMQTSIT